MPLIEQKLL